VAHDQVGDERVDGLTGAVRHYLGVSSAVAHCHRVQRLGDRPDLVELDQGGVGDAVGDSGRDYDRIGADVVVAEHLYPLTQARGQPLSAVVIALAKAVLDAPDREHLHHRRVSVDHVAAGELGVVDEVTAVELPELRGGRIQCAVPIWQATIAAKLAVVACR
jgi:hypothetical protein